MLPNNKIQYLGSYQMHLVSVVILTVLIFMNNALFAGEQLKPIKVQSTVLHAQSIDVISDEELERKLSNSIGETIKNELGVSSTYFGPGASRPIIRGLGSNRVRVLENGIDSLDASSASEDHAVTIDPYTADQIEILRGPSTLRYGPGAIGGVVNVINQRIPTRDDIESLEVKAVVEHATVSDGNTAAIELKGSQNSFNWYLDGLTRDTNDYDIDGFANEDEPEDKGRLGNSDLETDQYSVGGSYLTEDALVGLSFSRFDTEYGIPGAEEGDVRIDLKQYRYESLFELYDLSDAIESISLRSTYNNYRHFEILEGEVETTFDNEEFESRLEVVNIVNSQWDNIFGFQYNDREFSADGEEAFVAPVDEKRYGIFGITHYQTDTWELEGGVRYDRDELEPKSGEDEEFNVTSVSLGATRYSLIITLN